MKTPSKRVARPSLRKKLISYLSVSVLVLCLSLTLLYILFDERYSNGKQTEFDHAYEMMLERANNIIKSEVESSSYDVIVNIDDNSSGGVTFQTSPVETRHISRTRTDVKKLLCEFYDRFGVAVKMYINGEEFADSSDSAFMTLMFPKPDTIYQIDDPAMLDGFDQYTGGKYYSEAEYPDVRFCLQEYYIQGGNHRFVPVSIEVVKIPDNYGYSAEVIDRYSEETEQPYGYTYFNEKRVPDALPYFVRMGDKGISSGYDINNITREDVKVNLYQFGTNGLLHQTIMMSEYKVPSFFSEYGSMVILTAVSAMVITCMITSFAAYVRYSREKSMYDMIEYRRKTTNAMAHDLKTPLAAISAYSENLVQDPDGDKRSYYSSKIIENVETMNKMIGDILRFSKSEDVSNVRIDRSDVDVETLLKELAGEVEPLFTDAGVSLRLTISSKTVLKTDRALLKQSLLNLLTNASRYSTPGTETEAVLSGASLTVTNETGMVYDDVEKLKEPFVKGKKSRGEKDGTGLGLAIADNNLKMLGYRLNIKMDNGKFISEVRF